MTQENIRRTRKDFLALTNRIGQSYVGVNPKVAEREISAAARYARKATKASKPRKQT